MKSYVVHLIRHGTTAGNEQGRYVGSTDLPLSAAGEKRLRRLRSGRGYPEAQVCLSSPMKRCTETLRILYPEAKPILVRDFRECDFGEWEGKTAREIAASDERFRRWISGGGGQPVVPPGGESGGEFARRVCAAFERLVEGMMRSGTLSAVIVAHGGVLMAVLSAYGLPRAKFYDWMTQPGCGYSMRITPGLWMRSKVGEVFAKIPAGPGNGGDRSERIVLDLAREAADRAYGEKEGKDKRENPQGNGEEK